MDGSNTDPTLGWVWNEENQAYYRQEWNGEEWSTYWKRPDEMARRDSLADSVPSVEAIQGLGDTIRGDPSSGEVEPLDSSYTMQYQPRRFFRPGRMFSILYTEPLGGTAPNVNADNVSTVMFGEQVYSQIRRFIVVKEGKGFCYACPISTYGGRGTTKRGLDPSTHTIVYTLGTYPSYVSGETQLEKAPIPIVPAENTTPLIGASRANFAIHHPIQHNVKAKDLGMVHPEYIPILVQYARSESGW